MKKTLEEIQARFKELSVKRDEINLELLRLEGYAQALSDEKEPEVVAEKVEA